jgi:hypothetical protein
MFVILTDKLQNVLPQAFSSLLEFPELGIVRQNIALCGAASVGLCSLF